MMDFKAVESIKQAFCPETDTNLTLLISSKRAVSVKRIFHHPNDRTGVFIND